MSPALRDERILELMDFWRHRASRALCQGDADQFVFCRDAADRFADEKYRFAGWRTQVRKPGTRYDRKLRAQAEGAAV